jgi:hypothetical protein
LIKGLRQERKHRRAQKRGMPLKLVARLLICFLLRSVQPRLMS